MTQITDASAHKNTFFPLVLHVANEVLRVFADQVGASPTRLYVLSLLLKHGEMTQAELIRQLELDPAAISRHLRSLEEDGIVSRRVKPDHRRHVLVSLTEDGYQYLTNLATSKDRLEKQLFDEMGFSPQEHAIVLQALIKIDQCLDEIQGQNKLVDEQVPLRVPTPGTPGDKN